MNDLYLNQQDSTIGSFSVIEGTVPTRPIHRIRSAAMELGLSPTDLTYAAGLDPAVLTDDLARIPTTARNRLWESIRIHVGEDCGLLVAERMARGPLHAWDYLVTSGPTLAEGFREGAGLLAALTDPAVRLDVQESGRQLTISYTGLRFQPEVDREISGFALVTLLRRAREAAGCSLAPVCVGFAHSPPRAPQRLYAALGTESMRFGQASDSLTFIDVGGKPATADPGLFSIMRRHLEMNLASARPVRTFRDLFQIVLADVLADDRLSLDRVAVRLAMSPRTLQRRLGEEGTTWREEVDAVRRERAAQLLRDTDLPVSSIAARLGYAHHQALRRAFQRWTGHTPDTYRKAFAASPTEEATRSDAPAHTSQVRREPDLERVVGRTEVAGSHTVRPRCEASTGSCPAQPSHTS